MSLASPYQEHYYVADGVTTSFSFGEYFTGLSQAYVKCIIYFDDGTNCVPTFTVDMTTGFITIVTLTKPDGTVLTVPPAGSIVRVFRDTPEQQNVTASQLQNYTAKQLERIFDSVVAMIQEVSYSDLHKTIRLTETQRDVSMEELKEENDQAILYWDFETRQLKATDYGQNQVVKSDTVDRLVYLQPEGKIYFIPKGSNNPIAIGSATIHNDLGGRNAPDCHPESAITGLREHLQELRDKDIEIEEDVQIALNRSQEAKDTADEAKETAEYAQTIAEEAKDIAEDAKDVAEGIDEKAQTALDNSEEALDKVTQEITDRQDADDALQDQITDNKDAIEDHIADTNNPHSVTKAQVGLGNVDNTSDLDKPISTATQAALDLKMPISTKYGASISLTIDSSTYVVTAQLKDQDNNNLGTAQTIDLPLESVVVSGSYDSDTKEVILVLENGSEIRFSVADLISGLQSEITAQNPLGADLVNDSTSAHKFVTATEKTNWNNHIANTNNPHQVTKVQVGLGNVDNTSDLNKPISTATQTALDLKADKATTYTKTETDTLLSAKQDTISDLATIRSGAAAGATAVQPGDNVSELVNDAGYLTQHQTLADLGITATASEINVLDGITATTTELNYVDGVTSSIQTQLTNNANNISNEITNRQNADNGLQTQIDAIVAKSDVVDIVGTYAELQAYDTSGLGNNDVVKVISDSTHNDAPSYYRWVITGGVGAWVYIGSEAETYTKAETDALLNDKQDVLTAGSNITISGTTISATDTTYTGSDGITLTGTNFTNSGVRSVATGSTNGTISVNTNGTSADVAVYGLGSAAYTASTAYATSAQGAKADTALQSGDNVSELVNDAGYITGITSGDVTTALGYTPYSDANPNGYTSNVGTVTSVNSVSPDGSGNVSLTIPTVNDATITITQGGVTKGSFTLNQASGDTIALDAGGGGSYTAGSGIDITSDVISVEDLDCGTMS